MRLFILISRVLLATAGAATCVDKACTTDCVPAVNASSSDYPRGNCCGNFTSVCAYDKVFQANRCLPPAPMVCAQ
jgi:hypothetical protein